jgi:nicotinamide phosphoribosyltransferase
MNLNPATAVDGYKIDHKRQYPIGTQIVFSNLTSRGTRRKDTTEVVFAGLQYFIKDFLIKNWN